jgi:putative transposase
MPNITEKKHRLDKQYYIGRTIVSFTLCIKNKEKLFVSKNIVSVFEEYLIAAAKNYGIDVIIYLFMPDHLHLILQGKSDNSGCLKMLNMFKQRTGYWLRRNGITASWQKDYFDHIIGAEKDLMNQVYYILNNPVRKGYANDVKSYPYKGSTIMNLNEIEW